MCLDSTFIPFTLFTSIGNIGSSRASHDDAMSTSAKQLANPLELGQASPEPVQTPKLLCVSSNALRQRMASTMSGTLDASLYPRPCTSAIL